MATTFVTPTVTHVYRKRYGCIPIHPIYENSRPITKDISNLDVNYFSYGQH